MKLFSRIRPTITKITRRPLAFIERLPFISFLGLLVGIVVLIAVGNVFRQPQVEEETVATTPQSVEVFSLGEAPRIAVSGTVNRVGKIDIIAQTNGVVSKVNVKDGQNVYRGQTLISIGSSYATGAISSVSRQIAQRTYENAKESLPLQLEMIAKRREIAEKSDTSADDLRDIASKSIDDTKTQISLNESILASVDTFLASETPGTPEYVALQGQRAGILAALSGLRQGLRQTEYQTSGEHAPARLSDLSRELTLKQLEVEEKALQMGKDIAKLNLSIAYMSERFNYPASPNKGVVERVYVRPGDVVNPGMVLATIICEGAAVEIEVNLPQDLVTRFNQTETTTIATSGGMLAIVPRYVSADTGTNSLGTIIFSVPENLNELSDGEAVRLNLPVGKANTIASYPFVPVDAVYQLQEGSLLYIASPAAEGAYAVEVRNVELGNVFGSFVEVLRGLAGTEQVILNRSVIAGDTVTIANE